MSKARQLADLGNQIDDGAITGSNMVINGAMTVAQRGTSVTNTGAADFNTVDRFQYAVGSGVSAWRKWLNHSDNKVFRTWQGKL